MASFTGVNLTCEDGYIGTYVLAKASPVTGTFADVHHWSMYWECEGTGRSGTIVQNSTSLSSFSITRSFELPIDIAYAMPNTTSRGVTLRLVLYAKSGGTLADVTTTFTAYLQANSTPTISLPQVTTYDAKSEQLTGGNTTVIRYVSDVIVAIRAEAVNGANLKHIYVNDKEYAAPTIAGAALVAEINGIDSDTISIKAVDSRGLSTSIKYTIPSDRWVEYIKLTCNQETEIPDTDGNTRVTCSGNYFGEDYYGGFFGLDYNELTVEYRYKEKGGSWSNWATIAATINGTQYSGRADITGLDYQKTYVFECRATDSVMTISSAESAVTATPVFDWSEKDFAFNVPVEFRAGMTVNGKSYDFIVEQGVTGNWRWRKWNNGLAECWGFFTKTIPVEDWTAWGSCYDAPMLLNESYPFPFTEVPRETATLIGNAGGILEATALGWSKTTTASYFVMRPSRASNPYGYGLCIYACGLWK